MEQPSPSFDAPIPGMSLTAELGGRPWETPPQYSTVEDAINYYVERMFTPVFEEGIIDVLEIGVSVTSIVSSIQLNGVMEGLHSADVGLLISPVLMEIIMYIADTAKIDYYTGLEDTDEPRNSLVSKAITKFKVEQMDKPIEDTKAVQEPVESVEPVEEVSTGLMARRA